MTPQNSAKKRIHLPTPESIDFQLETLALEACLYRFLLWLFKEVRHEEFLENWHHEKIAKALMDVYHGKIKNLIINLPPRYTKTELVIKAFVSWCLAKNPKCKFIHLSYSDDLALDNSSAIREIVTSDEYLSRWYMELKKDSDSKKKWFNTEGGGMYATATGGQITGFGAGSVDSKVFAGAILIDDPLKPDDANSDTIRTRFNDRFNNTIKSRINSKDTPIIIIMQRLHEDDMTGFLLAGGSEMKFTHICLPALNEDGPSKYDPREKGDALWIDKHDEHDLELMRKADAGTFAGQMQQRPAPKEGNIFKWFQYYKELPADSFFKIHSWDMTFKSKSKTKKGSVDFVVGTEWGKSRSTKDIYLFPDMVRARMDFPDTLDAVKAFIKRHPDFKALLIEDKANGSGIISTLKKEGVKRVIEIEPEGDKEERANAIAPLFRANNVWLPDPSICPWIEDFVNELKVFPNGKQDDQVDSATQAITYLDNTNSLGMGDVNKKTDSYSKTFKKKQNSNKRKDSKKRNRPHQ